MKLHYYQKELLKRLTLSKEPLKFNQLILKGLESEHMNYHLKQLISQKLVKKEGDKYTLTNKGKDYTDSLEDDIKTEEKQPKTSIIAKIVRVNEDGEKEQLVCKRLRHPYYGKVGRITGKIKFGEKVEDTVKREIYEETGLKAKDINLIMIYRKMRVDKDKDTLQDVFFYICEAKNLEGTLISESEFQQNFWLNKKDFDKRDDLYKDFKWDLDDTNKELIFKESYKIAEGY